MISVNADCRIQHSSASRQYYVTHFWTDLIEGESRDNDAQYIVHSDDSLDDANPEHVSAAVKALKLDYRPSEGDSLQFLKTLRNRPMVDAVISLSRMPTRAVIAA